MNIIKWLIYYISPN